MGRSVLLGIVAGVVALVWAAPALSQSPTVFVDDATPAHYNAALGMSLDATQNQFPCANVLCGDPIINPAPEPDLSAASAALGDWLSNPPVFNANWSGAQAIPPSWDLNTETAIVYEIDAGRCGAQSVTGSFGVDNGIFVWVNGVYAFGALAPGGAIAGEYTVPLGNLPSGTNFVQILREDHGGLTGYSVQITGNVSACGSDDEDDDEDEDDEDDDDDEHGDHEHGDHEHGDHEHGDHEDRDR
jgi:hypothetical protein